jgi:hypothetical protein
VTTASRAAGRAEGERRKHAALDTLAARREALVLRGRRALLRLLDHPTATADAVRAAVQLPSGISPRLFGAVPGPLAAAGIIRAVGYAATARAVAHVRPLTVWALVDADAARRWLAAHPDTTDAAPAAEPPGCLY